MNAILTFWADWIDAGPRWVRFLKMWVSLAAFAALVASAMALVLFALTVIGAKGVLAVLCLGFLSAMAWLMSE